MTDFLSFLTEVVTHMDYFNGDISTIYIDHDEDKIVATGNHPKKQLFYRIESDCNARLEAPGCLGTIRYLKTILASSMMKNEPQTEIRYFEKNGELFAMSEILFKSSDMETLFKCTNPEIMNEKDKIRKFPRPMDAIFFPLTKQLKKKFDEVANVATPKADIRLFQMDYDTNYIRAIFGGGGHTSSLILASKDDITGVASSKFSNNIYLDRFRTMIRLGADKPDAKLAYHPKVLWVDFTTPVANHIVAIPVVPRQQK